MLAALLTGCAARSAHATAGARGGAVAEGQSDSKGRQSSGDGSPAHEAVTAGLEVVTFPVHMLKRILGTITLLSETPAGKSEQ
jgi:hypothetical protein